MSSEVENLSNEEADVIATKEVSKNKHISHQLDSSIHQNLI